MKKEINELLKNGGVLRINKFFRLERQVECCGVKKDALALVSSIHHASDYEVQIYSREYDSIKTEIAIAMNYCFEQASRDFIKEFENGYLH